MQQAGELWPLTSVSGLGGVADQGQLRLGGRGEEGLGGGAENRGGLLWLGLAGLGIGRGRGRRGLGRWPHSGSGYSGEGGLLEGGWLVSLGGRGGAMGGGRAQQGVEVRHAAGR